MTGPGIALAASARSWPESLHRFLLDHGGGVVRTRVMAAEQAEEEDYDVLVIDDVCSFLTPRLVAKVRERGREVVGVFSPDDGTDAKRRLLECGISDVIEMSAPPEEFVAAIAMTLRHRVTKTEDAQTLSAGALRIGVAGSASGVGCTEVAISVARHLSRSYGVVLVDLDQELPGVAQRLGLPLYPNLHTAVDCVLHEPSRLGETMLRCGRLDVIGGVAKPDPDRAVSRYETSALLDDLSARCDVVVADLGCARSGPKMDAMIVAGDGSPVGLGRLIRSVERLPRSQGSVLALVNRVRHRGRMSDEIRQELGLALPGVSSVLLPYDERVADASWDGAMVDRGRFLRATGELARVLAGELSDAS